MTILRQPLDRRAPLGSSVEDGTVRPAVPRVLIVSASVGAGHDGAATELARQAAAAGYAVDRVDFLDLFPRGVGGLLRAAYRIQLRSAPATWGWLLARLEHGGGRRWAARVAARLTRKRLLRACAPDPTLAVSTYPLASQSLADLRLRGLLGCPVVTFLTDMSVHPLWVAPGADLHLALHAEPARQAARLGARGVRIVGPAVSPAFTAVTPTSRATARSRFRLPTEAPLGLVVAGSWGVGDIVRTVHDLLAAGVVTPVVVCGSNAALRRRLEKVPGVRTLGWVDDMASLMHACDIVVQNAGGLTSLEARECGLPVVTYRSLPGHGHSNSQALEIAGWTIWARERAELVPALLLALGHRPTVEPSVCVPWAGLLDQPLLMTA
ncbi:glycosyltransferase [Nocardioides sp. KIGAM211]|uniref:Glycosyltransferase n=1 Tax=Nocardioides luti TaxID=2761101 RepID=A0A7X0RK01_9ACTN|nr:glycosyltransferase [Nocardioides luti]MBB6629748.1 glycosyltransferase [Nocardioides luti]